MSLKTRLARLESHPQAQPSATCQCPPAVKEWPEDVSEVVREWQACSKCGKPLIPPSDLMGVFDIIEKVYGDPLTTMDEAN